MAAIARGDGPKGFSLESSLMSRVRSSAAARFGGRAGTESPISRAGFDTRSKNRLMLAADYFNFTDFLAPVAIPVATAMLADFNFSTSRNVSDRNLPGGTSSVSGP